ncbi:MAG TPA: 30S ribosomal protein S20 [Symbiobacteriaceae bacterium]
MANIKSAKKRALIAVKRTERNRMVKSSLRTAVRKFSEAVKTESAGEKLSLAFKALDTAATKGVIHKNTANRKKARLAKRLNAIAK